MLIIGAKGHAKEVLDIVEKEEVSLCFFDNTITTSGQKVLGLYPIISSKDDVINFFRKNNEFVIGVGNPKIRFELAKLLKSWGGGIKTCYFQNVNNWISFG